MLLAIDPGTNFCGLSVCSLDNDKLQVNYTELINVTNSPKGDIEKYTCNKYGLRFLKIQRIVTRMNEVCKLHNITEIAIEGPFYSALRPQAHSALVEVVYAIKANIAFPNDISMLVIEPLLVKKYFAKKHMAKKEEMAIALIKHITEDTITALMPLDNISEHEIDSIAIAYSYKQISKELQNVTNPIQ